MNHFSFAIILIFSTFTYSDLVKRIDTLTYNQSINFTTSVISENPFADTSLHRYANTVYRCSDTAPTSDLLIANLDVMSGGCVAGAVYGIGSPRPFYLLGCTSSPPNDPDCWSFPTNFSIPLVLGDGYWMIVDTIRDYPLDSCLLPFFAWQSHNTSKNFTCVFKTLSDKYVLVTIFPLSITYPCFDSPPPQFSMFERVIVTSYLQTDGTTNFAGADIVHTVNKPALIQRTNSALGNASREYYSLNGRRLAGQTIKAMRPSLIVKTTARNGMQRIVTSHRMSTAAY